MSLYLHSVLGDPIVTQYVSVLAFRWPNCHKTCLWCGFRWPNCHKNWLCIHFYVTQLSQELPLYQPICDPIVTWIVFVSSFRWPNCHPKCVCVCVCCFWVTQLSPFDYMSLFRYWPLLIMSTLTLSLLSMILKISPLIFELSYMNLCLFGWPTNKGST